MRWGDIYWLSIRLLNHRSLIWLNLAWKVGCLDWWGLTVFINQFFMMSLETSFLHLFLGFLFRLNKTWNENSFLRLFNILLDEYFICLAILWHNLKPISLCHFGLILFFISLAFNFWSATFYLHSNFIAVSWLILSLTILRLDLFFISHG